MLQNPENLYTLPSDCIIKLLGASKISSTLVAWCLGTAYCSALRYSFLKLCGFSLPIYHRVCYYLWNFSEMNCIFCSLYCYTGCQMWSRPEDFLFLSAGEATMLGMTGLLGWKGFSYAFLYFQVLVYCIVGEPEDWRNGYKVNCIIYSLKGEGLLIQGCQRKLEKQKLLKS